MSKEKLKEYLQSISKDRVVELCLQYQFDAKIAEQQLAEKDKEIERLKVFEEAYYFNQTQVSQESMDLLLQNAYQVHNETQLAIQELEKLKKQIDNLYIYSFKGESEIGDELISSGELISAIDNQINELKGEKDE